MARLFMGAMIAHLMIRSADAEEAGYGYEEDKDGSGGPTFKFGGNFGQTFIKKFEWIPNGGKDGAEQEALEIIFNINGTDRSYRQFPVKQAYGKNNVIITDPKAPEFIEAMREFNARITHILHAFVEDKIIKQALAKKPGSFKEYCNRCKELLPKDAPSKPLDIFMQYQYGLKTGNKRTYLDIPTKRKHGAFLIAAVPGNWKEVKATDPDDSLQNALFYYDEDAGTSIDEKTGKTIYNKIHPFIRTGWFMNSTFAKMQKAEGEDESTGYSTDAETAGDEMNAEGSEETTTTANTW